MMITLNPYKTRSKVSDHLIHILYHNPQYHRNHSILKITPLSNSISEYDDLDNYQMSISLNLTVFDAVAIHNYDTALFMFMFYL